MIEKENALKLLMPILLVLLAAPVSVAQDVPVDRSGPTGEADSSRGGALLAGVISRIEIAGNTRVDDGTVRLQISSEEGKPLDSALVDADVKEIYRTGFFEQVVAKLRRKGDERVLVFEVVEKPALRQVLLQGNEEVSDEKLKEKLNIEARRFLDKRKIIAGIEAAKAYYQDEGYYDTEIEFIVTPVEQNQVDLTFVVEEGEEKKLREVVFEGNRDIEDSDLEDVVKTSAYSWWSSWLTGSGLVKAEQLKEDSLLLSRYYLNSGYADVRVADGEIEEIEDGLRVTFKIEEGPVYQFGEITASGDLLNESVEDTLRETESKSGEVFSVDLLRKDTFVVSEKFTDIGYAFANVEPSTDIDRESRVVNVDFAVDKGSLVYVDRIELSGNEKTADNVIRRSLKIQETELFSSSRIRRSQQLLERLGHFDEVTITPEPSGEKDKLDLTVAVREGSTGTFTAGAGVSSGDGFILHGRVSENNLFGTGNSLGADLNLGTRNENYVLSFDNPRLNDSYWSMGIDLLSVEREFDDFDREQIGGSLTFGYPLTFLGPEYLDDIRFSLRYELLRVDISDVEEDAPSLIIDQEGRTTSSSVTPRLVRNTIDNPLNPTEGSRQVASIELAGIGGDQEFWLVRLSNTLYHPLIDTGVGPLVFSQRTRFGYGETFDGEDFPLFRRFFPGGINSVRGFDARELGPKDEEGNEYGGNKQLVANFELIFPLFPPIGLKGVGFYDIGNAFDDDENIDFSELRHAAGWGIRWNSPLGPIRIEIGYALDREEGEDSVVTHFSFGAPL